MSRIICPYCFGRTTRRKLHMHCPEKCGREGVTFPPAKACPHGSEPMRSRFCPNSECANQLEYDYTRVKGRTVALIGATAAGKSTYIGVLIDQLRHAVGEPFGMALEFVGDKSRKRYEDDFAAPLRAGSVPVMTRTVRTVLPAPLLFMLKTPRPSLLRADRIRAAMMTFFDTAGEDVNQGKDIARLARYLDSAEGVILLVDPLQIAGVSPAGDAGMREQVKVVTMLAALLREQRGLAPSKRIRTPLAIALSKTDAISGALSENSPVRRHHTHQGTYDDSDGRHVHDEVRAWLHHWYGVEFDNVVANNFANYRYFGVSALGTPPDGQVLAATGVHPLRVEDPLFWLLAQFKILRTAGSS